MAAYEAEEHKLAEKVAFFHQLQALNESSDEDYHIDEVCDIIRKFQKAVPSLHPFPARSRIPLSPKKTPALQRAISAPVSSLVIVKETPPLPRQQSLLHEEVTTPSTDCGTSIIKDTPSALAFTGAPAQERRTVSIPSIGTDLILKFSTGIESMLGKKMPKRQKKNGEKVKLVAETERIFKDLIFYYIPPDDKTPLRKLRIQKAKEFGATWAKQDWDIERITHVIVEKDICCQAVMSFLKLETWPTNIVLVKEQYPIECIQHKRLLDPKQIFYEVPGRNELPLQNYETSAQSPKIKTVKSRTKNGPASPKETSPPSRRLPQKSLSHPRLPGAWPERTNKEAGDKIRPNTQEADPPEDAPKKRPRLSGQGDTLDEMIAIAKGMAHLPLDDEEDDESEASRPNSRDDAGTSNSEDECAQSRINLKSRKRGAFSEGLNQENFACMKGGTGVNSGSNPNARTIEILQEMGEYYERRRDQWRQIAYRKAVTILRRQPKRINTYEEAILLPNIGNRLAQKIEEVVVTDRLRRLENAKLDMDEHALSLFMKIYGVGLSQAWKWILQGHRTMEDLLQHVSLTDNQKLGIEKFDDLQTPIPRSEVTALGEIVKKTAAKIDPEVKVIIGGSYRRGAAICGDIDCLLTKPGTKTSRDLLPFVNRLVSDLTTSGFLVATLAEPSKQGSASKWHGCCVLPAVQKQIWRRIDLLMVPETELGAALIYFTGDDIFNRSMRLLSSRKGWRLNQRGLYKDVMRGPGGVKISEGTLVEGADEKKIFEILGVPWRPPHHRICR